MRVRVGMLFERSFRNIRSHLIIFQIDLFIRFR